MRLNSHKGMPYVPAQCECMCNRFLALLILYFRMCRGLLNAFAFIIMSAMAMQKRTSSFYKSYYITQKE